jgi:hypothetical protein
VAPHRHRRGLPLLWRMVAVLLLMVAVDVMLVVVEVVVVVADATLVVLQLGLHEVMARGRDVVLDGGVGVAHRRGTQLGDGVAVACKNTEQF